MPLFLSFSLTEQQFMDGSQDVTRRVGWRCLKCGQILCGVRRRIGIGRGNKVVRLGYIEVMEVSKEPLNAVLDVVYGPSECKREGFPEMRPLEFVRLFSKNNGNWLPTVPVTRIAFRHIDDLPGLPPTLWGTRNC
jgi:hypothetical protein